MSKALRISNQPLSCKSLVGIFNQSQHISQSDETFYQLKLLYKKLDYDKFEQEFERLFKKLLQSPHNIYFKASCDFVTRFLHYLSEQSTDLKNCQEQFVPNTKKRKGPAKSKNTTKRRANNCQDELADLLGSASNQSVVSEVSKRYSVIPNDEATPISNHDRLIFSCVAEVAMPYMSSIHDETRLNAVYFIFKFVSNVKSMDEEICFHLKEILPKRIRDKKPVIRAHSVCASTIFQDNKLIKEAFYHHFQKDPELVVRKALLQVMDTKVFGYNFLVESTQDTHEPMRKSAYHRLGKTSPKNLTTEQLHKVLHNGLNERERQASYVFRTQTLEPWIGELYKDYDLLSLMKNLDVVTYYDDVVKLLDLIYTKELDDTIPNSTLTGLHKIVELFKERWFGSNGLCLPSIEEIDEKIVTIWLSLIKFCKSNMASITPLTVCAGHTSLNANNEDSIEKILHTNEQEDEIIDLYDVLTPDLINLVNFVQKISVNFSVKLSKCKKNLQTYEFIYQKIMDFILTYEIGDELERKSCQEIFGSMLKEGLLTDTFEDYIIPQVKCLSKLIYTNSSSLMVSYISELINNVRSNIEDVDSSFRDHPNELIKCLQMFIGCLQNTHMDEVPQIMKAHMIYLTLEGSREWFEENPTIRSLVVTCTATTALADKEYAENPSTTCLLLSGCYDSLKGVRTVSFKGLVDICCQHDIEVPIDRICKFLCSILCDYGKYDPEEMTRVELNFMSTILEGAAKLFYFRKISSPQVLAHIVIWWYHPRTHSKLKQFIGLFLPLFVEDISKKQLKENDDWLSTLLENTFIPSIEFLHSYIIGAGYNIMSAADIQNLINFLTCLVPIPSHATISDLIDDRIAALKNNNPDLVRYLKASKHHLKKTVDLGKLSEENDFNKVLA